MSLWILEAIVVALLAGGGTWEVQGWRYDHKISSLQADQAKLVVKTKADAADREKAQALATIAAVNNARSIERAQNQQLQGALNEATKREAQQRAATAAARGESDGLRDDLAALRARLPGLTADASRERADTLAQLLGECSERYQAVASAADHSASDVRTLIDAWPR